MLLKWDSNTIFIEVRLRLVRIVTLHGRLTNLRVLLLVLISRIWWLLWCHLIHVRLGRVSWGLPLGLWWIGTILAHHVRLRCLLVRVLSHNIWLGSILTHLIGLSIQSRITWVLSSHLIRLCRILICASIGLRWIAHTRLGQSMILSCCIVVGQILSLVCSMLAHGWVGY